MRHHSGHHTDMAQTTGAEISRACENFFELRDATYSMFEHRYHSMHVGPKVEANRIWLDTATTFH